MLTDCRIVLQMACNTAMQALEECWHLYLPLLALVSIAASS